MKKNLKKSDVLREGYIKGLMDANRVLKERLSAYVPHYDTRVKNLNGMMEKGYYNEILGGLEEDFAKMKSMYDTDGVDMFFEEDIKTIVKDMRDKVVKLKIAVDAFEEHINDEEWYLD